MNKDERLPQDADAAHGTICIFVFKPMPECSYPLWGHVFNISNDRQGFGSRWQAMSFLVVKGQKVDKSPYQDDYNE